jgi:type II secretory pathway pseudopilin PulG
MKTARAFTLIEALVIIVLIVLVIGLLIPAMQGSHPANKMKNSNQLRMIMVDFCLWSDANSDIGDLPGGIDPTAGHYPPNATDPAVVARLWALIAGPGIDPLNPKVLISPIAAGSETVWGETVSITPGVTTAATAHFGSDNVSYALLSTRMGSEWHNNTNARCPLICDRNRGTRAAPASSWSTTGWQGTVAWGDVHATFETSSINLNETLYGNDCPTNNLWAPATSGNAGMVNPGD